MVMAPQELIDLSLSTDDEAPLRPSPGRRKDPELKRPLDSGFMLLEDDFDSTVHIDESRPAGASKRRKLSSSPEGHKKQVEGDEAPQATIANWPENDLYRETSRTTQRGRLGEESHQIIGKLLSDDDSSPFRGFKSKADPSTRISDDSDESFPEDIVHGSMPSTNWGPQLSERTRAYLASVDKSGKRKKVKEPARNLKVHTSTAKNARLAGCRGAELDANDNEKPKRPVSKVKLTDAEKAAKAEEKESLRIANKEKKAQEKEEEQERKRLLKEEKTRQKQNEAAIAEVNRAQLDKKISGPQMIVDLPASIDGQVIDTQIREFLKNLQIEVTSYQSPLPNLIKWRRKVKSRYSEEKGYWEHIEPMEIEDERHVLCLMSAREFVALASANEHQQDSLDVEAHVLQLKEKFEGCKPIYLIEGLNSWMRKNKTTLNRAYQAAMLNQIDGHENSAPAGSQQSRSRRKKPVQEHVDEDMIEDALLRLQVMNGCLVHHTAAAVETAEWVASFTQHISTIPFK